MNQHNLPDTDILYQALLNRDSSLEGIFYFAVKTTGIFCRPSCSARKPKKENVDYFDSTRAALENGYRPCKVCKPMSAPGHKPDWLGSLLDDIQASPDAPFSDAELRARSIEPARLRRWFQKQHGMTFHAYLKTLRVNRAYQKMQHAPVTEVAFDSGYQSLSGFHQAFKNLAGFSPSQSRAQSLVTIARLDTPLGPMFAGASEQGLCLLEFCDRKMIEAQIAQLQKRLKARFLPGQNHHLTELETQLAQYFSGTRMNFDIPLDVRGTEFQCKAWAALQQIPYGETRSYLEQATVTGNPGAVRAVASANAKNRIAIVIPCHRVIAKNGSLAGFGGGVWRKKYLLDLESGQRQA